MNNIKNSKKKNNQNNNNNNINILGACLEECVHVAGILNFMTVAEDLGFKTKFLGPAVPISEIIRSIKKFNPEIITISYRLTPHIGLTFIKKFILQIKKNNLENKRFLLGCLPRLAKKAKKLNFFNQIYIGGETAQDIISILKFRTSIDKTKIEYPKDLLSLIEFKRPYPIIRTHFGLPSLQKTIEGIKHIAENNVIDVISIAPDQPAQEWLQQPKILKAKEKGAGGVPIRSKNDLKKIYEASQTGNHPLLRIYSGTQDLVKNSKLFDKTINNAWTATPIFWYSELDGRGPLRLQDAIEEHFENIKWHVKNDIPVEINDPHQWGLRMAPDHLVAADAYLCAKIAKELGVKTYIEQMMFNIPVGNSLKMDLARVLAMMEIVEPLKSKNFRILRETRTGLAYLAPQDDIAKGQLVTSTVLQMAVKPHILHIVNYCEAKHAANSADIIESSRLLKRVLQDTITGLPDLTKDQDVQDRKEEILEEAHILLDGFKKYSNSLGIKNPYLSSEALTESVKIGLFDAPQLKGKSSAKGKIRCRIIKGKCVVVDEIGNIISEKNRLAKLGIKIDSLFKNIEKKKVKEEIKI